MEGGGCGEVAGEGAEEVRQVECVGEAEEGEENCENGEGCRGREREGGGVDVFVALEDG